MDVKKNKISPEKAKTIIILVAAFFIVWYIAISAILLSKKTWELSQKLKTYSESWTNLQKICFQEYCFDMEVAKTPEQRQKWLMYREGLSDQSWMLFIFPSPDFHNFWMKNTLIELDIIRLNKKLEILHIEKNTKPCGEELSKINSCPSYWPNLQSDYVLEVAGGVAEKIWLTKWQNMILK